jgi:predicted TIM-barrel fold metal-dependent hydrolase
MRFFDCGAMAGRHPVPRAGRVASPEELLREMDRFRIEQSLFSAYRFEAEATEAMNRATFAAARNSSRLVPCGVMTGAPSRIGRTLAQEANDLIASGARAIRMVPSEGPSASPLTLRRFALDPLLDRIQRSATPLLIDAAEFHTAQGAATSAFEQIAAMAAGFPRLPIVLLQPKYNAQADLIAVLRRYRNVYCTIPLLGLFREMESLAAIAGADRLLFGAYLPNSDPALPIGMITYSKLPVREREMIAGGNLRRLLGVDRGAR